MLHLCDFTSCFVLVVFEVFKVVVVVVDLIVGIFACAVWLTQLPKLDTVRFVLLVRILFDSLVSLVNIRFLLLLLWLSSFD